MEYIATFKKSRNHKCPTYANTLNRPIKREYKEFYSVFNLINKILENIAEIYEKS